MRTRVLRHESAGYSSEALTLAQGLQTVLGKRLLLRQFGEEPNEAFFGGLPKMLYSQIRPAFENGHTREAEVAVCHSTPDVWVPSKFPGWDELAPCPPPGALYTVGRTMYETDRIPTEWVERCNRMDEVWVPTEFHRETFAAAGVERGKLVVLGEAVDTQFFDPAKHRLLQLPPPPRAAAATSEPLFRFLSVFKWELRKGWDLLLQAYFEEFAAHEPVLLLLKTEPFYSSGDFTSLIRDFAEARGLPLAEDERPSVQLLTQKLPLHALPRLYRAVDAFVLPSRGEGWGRPHMEAMAMGLPVIATNWSGSTAFLSEEVGYPLEFELAPVAPELGLAGHQWAAPSIPHLRRLMRHVFEHREEARVRGAAARELVASSFTPKRLAEGVERELRRVAGLLEPRRVARKQHESEQAKMTAAETVAEGAAAAQVGVEPRKLKSRGGSAKKKKRERLGARAAPRDEL